MHEHPANLISISLFLAILVSYLIWIDCIVCMYFFVIPEAMIKSSSSLAMEHAGLSGDIGPIICHFAQSDPTRNLLCFVSVYMCRIICRIDLVGLTRHGGLAWRLTRRGITGVVSARR
jgi:hypothetical protein